MGERRMSSELEVVAVVCSLRRESFARALRMRSSKPV